MSNLAQFQLVCGLLAIMTLLPAWGCDRIGEYQAAAESVEITARVKELLLAMEDFREKNGGYPDHLNPNYSWRVELIDFLDDTEHVQSFDLSKKWNDESNEDESGANVFAYTSLRAESQSTRYSHFVLVVDEGTVFHDEGVLTTEEIEDGADETAIMIELIRSDIVWSEPKDINIEQAIEAVQNFPRPLEVRLGLADGTVHSLPPDTPAEAIRSLFLANDGVGIVY